jgi:hypothetical protein
MRLRQWLWVAGVIGLSGAARAEDVVLEGVEVRSGEECLEVLGEFNWYCAEFERALWVTIYEDTYWNLTVADPTRAYWADFDDDGRRDVIVSTQWGCGVAGCEHRLLFGAQASKRGYFGISAVSDDPPLKTTCDDGPGVRYGQNGQCLSVKFIQSTKLFNFESEGEN